MVLIDSVYAKGGGIAQRKLLTSHPAVPGSNLDLGSPENKLTSTFRMQCPKLESEWTVHVHDPLKSPFMPML